MHKIKLIAINIVILVLLGILFEYFIYINFISYEKFSFQDNIRRYINAHKIIDFNHLYKAKKESHYFRDTIIEKSRKSPILIFGCSFGYGYGLKEEQALSYKLAKYTNRSVYNRSISSYGIQIMPYMLENFELEKEIPNPEYIIFIFIDDHAFRLYRRIMAADEPYYDIHYKYKKSPPLRPQGNLYSLELEKPNYFIYRFPIVRFFEQHYRWYLYSKSKVNDNFDYMKLHFEKAKSLADKKFPNAKFVILKFSECKSPKIHDNKRWKELEDEGFIVLDTNKLTNEVLYDKKYKMPDGIHPNETAWDIVVPALAKALNL